MGVYILVDGATVECAHKGSASAGLTSTRVKIDGKPVIPQSGPWTVKGCSYPPNSGPPDTAISFTTGTTRVTVEGQPILTASSTGQSAATGTPAVISDAGQTKVKGL